MSWFLIKLLPIYLPIHISDALSPHRNSPNGVATAETSPLFSVKALSLSTLNPQSITFISPIFIHSVDLGGIKGGAALSH